MHCCDATYIPLSPVWLTSQAQEEPSHTYKAAIETLACRRLQCSLSLCWALSCDDIDDAGKEVRKREQSKSPLNELDDEPLPTHDDSVGFSASAIADIVRHEIRMGISPLEARLNSMETVFGKPGGQHRPTIEKSWRPNREDGSTVGVQGCNTTFAYFGVQPVSGEANRRFAIAN